MKGTLAGYRDVWFSDRAIANILSMAKVKETCHVSYDSKVEDAFVVEKMGRTMKFRKSNKGLYYFDTKKSEACFVQMVEDNKNKFTARQVKGAERARRFLAMVGRPSMKDLANMIKINLIPNLPVSLEDIRITAKIYRKDLGSLMEKTTKRKPARVMTDTIDLLREIKEMHNKLTIAADL
eukprot:13307170-Ditylum_brightwellii.AAC.1